MSYSTSEIRAAMIQLGQKRGAEYPLCVVRDVIEVFKADIDHPVKDAVIDQIKKQRLESPFSNLVIDRNRTTRDLANPQNVMALKLKFNTHHGLVAVMAKEISVHYQTLQRWLNGEYFMPMDKYNLVISKFEELKNDLLGFEKARERAMDQGLKHFIGRACVKCAGNSRYTNSGACIACAHKRLKQKQVAA